MNNDSILVRLPPELCNLLCGYLDPESIDNLLQTCVDLNHKLRNGGLKDLSLVFRVSSPLTSWPKNRLCRFGAFRSLHVALPGHSRSTFFSLKLSDKDFGILPRELAHLSLAFDLKLSNQDALLALPSNLRSLVLPTCTSLTGETLAQLPRQLTRLELQKAHQIGDAGLEHLPPLLVRLNLATARISSAGLRVLPVSLTSLNLEKNEILTPDDLGLLPPHLTELWLIRPLRNATDDHISLLPSSIKSINLGYNCELSDIGISRLSARVESLVSDWNFLLTCNALAVLPRSLRSLSVAWPQLNDDSLSKLPTKLTSLLLDTQVFTDKCFLNLPASLTSLELPHATKITDNGVKSIIVRLTKLSIPHSRITPEVTPFLSKSLTSFDFLPKTYSQQLEMLHVEYLPQYLLELAMDGNQNMTDELFARLPRFLTSLSVDQLVLNDPSTLLGLPLHLRRLKLKLRAPCNNSVWTYLPENIVCLFLDGAVFDVSAVPLLPRKLKELALSIVEPRHSIPHASAVTSDNASASQRRMQRGVRETHPSPQLINRHDELEPGKWGPDVPPGLTFVRSAHSVYLRCYQPAHHWKSIGTSSSLDPPSKAPDSPSNNW